MKRHEIKKIVYGPDILTETWHRTIYRPTQLSVDPEALKLVASQIQIDPPIRQVRRLIVSLL